MTAPEPFRAPELVRTRTQTQPYLQQAPGLLDMPPDAAALPLAAGSQWQRCGKPSWRKAFEAADMEQTMADEDTRPITRRPSDAALAAAFWEHRWRQAHRPAEFADPRVVRWGNDLVQRARELDRAATITLLPPSAEALPGVLRQAEQNCNGELVLKLARTNPEAAANLVAVLKAAGSEVPQDLL